MGYYVGIDMAARSSHICVINDQQRVLLDQKVPNELDVIDDLIKRFRKSMTIVVEASFNWYWIVDHFIEQGIDTKLAHPAMVKAITTAKIKTDRRDAYWLAELLRTNLIPESHICPIEQRRLRDLCRLRWRFAERNGTSLRQLRQVIANEGYHTVSTDTLRHLDIDALETDDEVHDICRTHQRYQHHIGDTIQTLDDIITGRIAKYPKIRWAVNTLRKVAGFGPVNATTIVLESGDIRRFPSHRRYCSYARLAPGVSQSGESVKQGRANKAGNEHLKRAFTNAAMSAGQHDPRIGAFRDRHRKRRSSQRARNMIVNNIVAHKLATGVYHALTKHEPIDEEKLFVN